MKSTHQLKHLNGVLAALALCVVSLPAMAQSPVINVFDLNEGIPDGSSSGLANSHSLTFAGMNSITSVRLSLDIEGGYNGDYYCYLYHNGVSAVLLNRVGQSTANPGGYSDSGMNVTFSDFSVNDVHVYQDVSGVPSGALTGVWAPDGRMIDPQTVTISDLRINDLSVFEGTDPNGDWTLFVADMSSGAQGTLKNWTLAVDGVQSVPEPATLTLLLGTLAAYGLRRAKQAPRAK